MPLNESELKTLLEVAEKAHPLAVTGCRCTGRTNFRTEFRAATCAELVREVLELRERWNTRFNTLCGNCGNRYRGPRDEYLHGIGKCASEREQTDYMGMFSDTNVGDD